MKKKIIISIVSILVVLILAVGGYIFYLWNSVQSTADKMHESVKLKNHKEPKLTTAEPISILLLGVDQRSGDVGRSDTTMVMTLNPEKKTMQMVSIPRDTRVDIPGKGIHKMNAAYAYGGPALAMQTVENFTGIQLDYYIRVNMEALSSLVDAVGGVTVNNTLDWIDEGYYKKGYHYQKGNIELDGPKALGFVRMRHLDPNGDFGRNERQRKVINAILDEAVSIKSVTKFSDILSALGDNVKTNMTFDNMVDIEKNYKDVRQNTTQYEVKGSGQTIDKAYFLVVPDAEKQKVSSMLKDNLK